jgi:hypothetical protein
MEPFTASLMIGAQLWGGYEASLAARSEADYMATNHRINAMFNELAAEDAMKRGSEAAGAHMKQVRKLQGSQRAAMAASGVNVDVGSASAIQEETGVLGAMDMITIQNNAYREAMGYKLASINEQAGARFAGYSGENRSRNALLTGGIQALDSFYRMRK